MHAAIVDGAIELTNMVSRAQKDLTYSPHVRRCIAYINKNPDRKLTVAAVAAHCGLSPDYLSHLFKCELGVNLSTYMTTQKLELAKTLLWEAAPPSRCVTAWASPPNPILSPCLSADSV